MLFASPDVRLWLQVFAIGALAVAAWRIGGGPERALAGVLVGLMVGDQFYHLALEGMRFAPAASTAHLLLDCAALAASLAVALTANRIYPLWFAAFQLLALLAHLAREVADGVAQLAYMILYIGPSYFQIATLALGIWLHRRRMRRCGPYRPWRSFSPPSLETGRPNSRRN